MSEALDCGNNYVTANNVAKAWAYINGDGVVSLLDSFNCDSVTDDGTGLYTITVTRNFSSANYAISTSADWDGSGSNARVCTIDARAVVSFQLVRSQAGTQEDGDCSFIAYGDE